MINLAKKIQELTPLFCTSGCETDATSFFKGLMTPLCDEVKEDILGNIICTKRGKSDKVIMFIAHIDEIGLMVKHIEDNGLLRFGKIGGVDESLLYGRNVTIRHALNYVDGIIGSYPIHFGNRSVDKDISKLWIDIGAKSLDEAQNTVSIGDFIKIKSEFICLQNNLISAGGLDDKCGIIILINLMKNMCNLKPDYTIVCVASVQEEIGSRGAITAAYDVSPDIAIAIDVTHATDIPNVNKAKFGNIVLGRGPVIPYGCDVDTLLQNNIKDIAFKTGIAIQIEALPEHSGTDIHHVKINKAGCLTGIISIPCRYMHTSVETVSLKDIQCAIDLVGAFIQHL